MGSKGGGGIKLPSPEKAMKRLTNPSTSTILAGGPASVGGQYEADKDEQKAQDQNDALKAINKIKVLTPEQQRQFREQDMKRGLERGAEFFGEGKLGRVDDTRSADIASVVDQRREISQQGFGAQAFQGAREARLRGLNRSDQQAQRQLGATMARSGIAGPLAGAQAVELMKAQQAQRAEAEQQLFLNEVAQKQAALGSFESSVGSAQASELQRKQFNLEQRQREILGQVGLGLTEAQLGSAERSGSQSADMARGSSIAQIAQAGKKK